MAGDDDAQTPSQLETFFDAHAPNYMENVFVRATKEEIEFLIEELRLKPGMSILDAGCGTGRHSVALACRGFDVTGVDLSSGMLAEARKAAQSAGAKVEFFRCDLTQMTLDRTFDTAICLCEGGFGLLPSRQESTVHDLRILKNIAGVLKPGGRFVMTALNGARFLRLYGADDIASGKFDPITLTERSTMEIVGSASGETVTFYERAFVPSELALMLQISGFRVENIWGGTAGNWGRRSPDPDEWEIMAVAVRIG